MRFSDRTAWETEENAFAARVRLARESGRRLVDLTVSNPTECGFRYDATALLEPLAAAEALRYEPEPFGMRVAREAVVGYYRDVGASVDLQRVCLTTSTSEAYSFLFRLLCDPGDEVLVASPSYPLFDYIARLDGVRLVDYPLLYDSGWLMDMHALRAAVTERTRAIVVVHPNNPTGHYCSMREQQELREMCAELGLALVVDEVFLDYAMKGGTRRSFAVGMDAGRALTFVLSGISKVCGLPQMKCSWIAAGGPWDLVREAMGRLEIVADTFLSMNAPVQHALPRWLAGRGDFQEQVRKRMEANVVLLDGALRGSHCERLAMEAGWTAILRVPRTVRGAAFCDAALEEDVILQPGEFYGLGEGRVVVSLLTPVEEMRQGMERLRAIAG